MQIKARGYFMDGLKKIGIFGLFRDSNRELKLKFLLISQASTSNLCELFGCNIPTVANFKDTPKKFTALTFLANLQFK